MALVAGKYQLVDSHNFSEVLTDLGVPEDYVKKLSDAKNILEIAVDGKKISAKFASETFNHSVDYIIGEEVQTTLPDKKVAKSTATQNGNVLTVDTKVDGGPGGKRVYTFSDTGLTMVLSTGKPGGKEAKRTYKRI